MKKLLFIGLVLLPAISFSQEIDQAEKLKMMAGTWTTDLSTFKSTIAGFDQFPEQKIECNSITEGSMYCTYSFKAAKGQYSIVQSELFAYNQATGKIHNMTFEEDEVHYGYLSFEENLMTWASTDVEGNIIRSGTMVLKPDSMEQKGKMKGVDGEMSITYKRVE